MRPRAVFRPPAGNTPLFRHVSLIAIIAREEFMDQRIIDLYDSFTHGFINRRDFMDRLGLLAGSTAAATTALTLRAAAGCWPVPG